jgi:hypothetical protein
MANTFVKIASVTVGAGGASTIDFTSIPSTYTDLCILLSLRNNRTGFDRSTTTMRLNADTGSNYSTRTVYAADGSVGSDSTSSGTYGTVGNSNSANNNANTFTPFTIYIPNYAGSTAKSFSVEYAQESTTSTWVIQMIAGLWNQTSASTSITLGDLQVSSSFVQYSTATLYGIKNS